MKDNFGKKSNRSFLSRKKGSIAFVAFLCAMLLLAGCGSGPSKEVSVQTPAATEQNTNKPDAARQGVTTIQLTGNGADISSNNAQYQKNTLYIVAGGTYRLSGNLTDSVIEVNAGKKDEVHLVMDNVTLTNAKGPVLNVKQAKTVTIELPAGTENTMTSGDSSNIEKADGVIYSKDDLILTGEGKLTLTTEYKHAIVANDTLKIEGGTYTIQAPGDALHVNDRIDILGGILDITAGDDAIHADNDDGTGQLFIAGGEITIHTCYEGLEAHEIVVDGGDISVKCKDDGINAGGDRTASITINGGTIAILHEEGRDGDGLDSNGSIAIHGGRILVSMNDSTQSYALDSDGAITLTGGTVLACGSAGMAECFASDSAQGFLQKNIQAPANTSVLLKDAEGTVLLEETVPYAFSNLVLTTPELKVGDKVTLQVGDTTEEITIDNTRTSGIGGFGGRGDRGGMGQPPEKPEGGKGQWENHTPPDQRDRIDFAKPK